MRCSWECCFFFFQAEDGIRDDLVTWSSDVCSSDLYAFKNMFEDRIGDLRIEDDRNFLGLYLASAKPADCALGSNFADVLGRFQSIQAARYRVPVVALHGAFIILRDWNGSN